MLHSNLLARTDTVRYSETAMLKNLTFSPGIAKQAEFPTYLRILYLNGELKLTSGHKCEILKYTNASGR